MKSKTFWIARGKRTGTCWVCISRNKMELVGDNYYISDFPDISIDDFKKLTGIELELGEQIKVKIEEGIEVKKSYNIFESREVLWFNGAPYQWPLKWDFEVEGSTCKVKVSLTLLEEVPDGSDKSNNS